MHFLRTKQVPGVQLTGNHNLLSSIAGVRHNTWKPASSRGTIASTLTGWADDVFKFCCRNEVQNKVAIFVAWESPSCVDPWQLLTSHLIPVCARHAPPHTKHEDISVIGSVRYAWVKQSKPFFSCFYPSLSSLRQTGWWTLILHLLHIDHSSMSRHKTRPGTFQFTAVLVLTSVTADAAVVGQNNAFHCSNTMVWFRSQMYEGVWWAYVSIVPQTMKPSIVLSVLPGGGRTHSITGLQAVVLAARAQTHTQTHTHFLKNWSQKQRQGQWGVRLKIQPWFAQHWWVKATAVMSRGGRGLTISKSAAKKNDVVRLCKDKLKAHSRQWCAVC